MKLTRSTRGILDERHPRLRPEALDDVEDTRRQARLEAEPAEPPAPRAGACSDGFRTEPFPQKIDGKAFHATLGSGVLNEIRSAATPTGRRSVSTVRWGIEAVVVRPYERRPSPATKRPISIAASVSPRASASDLPVSAATSSLASSRRSRRSSAIARTTSPRSTGRTRRPAGLGLPRGCDRCRRVVGAGPRDAAERRAVGGPRLVEPGPVRRAAAPRPRRGSAPPRGSPGRPAAVDDEVRAGDVRRGVRGEEDDGADRLRDVHQAPERRARREGLDERRRLPVLDAVRGQRVDADAAAPPVRREVAREVQRAPTSRPSTRPA